MRHPATGLTMSILLAAIATAAAGAPPITEAAAAKIVDRTEAAWTSMDASRIKALYAPRIVGFDVAAAPLVTNRATWDRNQDASAAVKFDRIVEKARRVQILGPDIFVMSGIGDIASSAMPANDATMRYTDVFQRQGDGSWLIVNEHVSIAPKG